MHVVILVLQRLYQWRWFLLVVGLQLSTVFDLIARYNEPRFVPPIAVFAVHTFVKCPSLCCKFNVIENNKQLYSNGQLIFSLPPIFMRN